MFQIILELRPTFWRIWRYMKEKLQKREYGGIWRRNRIMLQRTETKCNDLFPLIYMSAVMAWSNCKQSVTLTWKRKDIINSFNIGGWPTFLLIEIMWQNRRLNVFSTKYVYIFCNAVTVEIESCVQINVKFCNFMVY